MYRRDNGDAASRDDLQHGLEGANEVRALGTRHGGQIRARAEDFAGAGQHNATNLMVGVRPTHCLTYRLTHIDR